MTDTVPARTSAPPPPPDDAELDPRFANDDLRPVPLEQRTWTTYNFAALWVGMAINVPTWTLAAGLITLGMDWVQAVLTIAIANVIVLAPMVLTGHAGPKYGIPFPVLARASFGVLGANLPALVRGLAACVWFGIQTWVGGQSIFFLAGRLFGADSWWAEAGEIGGYAWTLWLCFAAFFALEIWIILRGMDTLRRFESWAAPVMLVGAGLLLLWIANEAGGFGPLLDQPSELGWGADFWDVFFPSLMGMIGFWSTLSLNIPDFTRFGSGQRAQVWGQSLGLPTTMALFALLSVLVTSGSQAVYGEPIWDPAQLAARMDNELGIVFALFVILLATLTTNIAANLVSPAYDLSNVAPRRVTFRTGALIAATIGVVIFPWKLYEDPDIYIFTWLGTVGGLLGAVSGILIADYWLLRGTRLHIAELYRAEGRYWYDRGWNWRAVAAFLIGGFLAVGGSYSGPYPEDGLVPFLQPLADYGWAVGLAAGFIVHALLMRLIPPAPPAPVTATATAPASVPAETAAD